MPPLLEKEGRKQLPIPLKRRAGAAGDGVVWVVAASDHLV
jgi:hypothetical protein